MISPRLARVLAYAGGAMILALAFTGSGVMTYALVLEKPWLSYTNIPFPAAQRKTYKPGEVVQLIVARCNSSNDVRVYRITHSLQRLDEPGWYVLPADEANMAPGCRAVTSSLNKIPLETVPGHYRVVGAGIVQGMIRDHVVPWASQSFYVTP